MIRIVTRWWLPLVMVCVLLPSPAVAQLALRPSLQTTSLQATSQTGVMAEGELHGIVQDDRGIALAGAVVSALGSTTAFAVSDRDGDYAATVRALLDAGTRLGPGEYMPRHAGVRAVLRQFEAG